MKGNVVSIHVLLFSIFEKTDILFLTHVYRVVELIFYGDKFVYFGLYKGFFLLLLFVNAVDEGHENAE